MRTLGETHVLSSLLCAVFILPPTAVVLSVVVVADRRSAGPSISWGIINLGDEMCQKLHHVS